MPWIECHHNFFDHPKTIRLADLLHCSEERVTMGLFRFWFWCLDYAPDGDLRPYEPSDLARAFRHPQGKAEQFVSAMIQSGWLDTLPYFRVHNWWKHVGLFLQGRYKRKPEIWQRIRELYEEVPPADEKPEIIPEIAVIGGEPTVAVRELHQSSTGIVLEQPQSCTGAAPDHLTKPNLTIQNRTNTTTPLPPSSAEGEGGGGGGGFQELVARIHRRTRISRISENDQAKLMDLYERHGPEALEACSWLHSGVTNVAAYLKAVLDKRSRVEVIAERARELLRAEGKEVR